MYIFACSSDTGRSKGYGLVRYECSQAAAQARQLLDGRQCGGNTLQADWLNSTFTQYSQLHSKCLYVDCLPDGYRDMTAYRKLFSVVKNPPYCQVTTET